MADEQELKPESAAISETGSVPEVGKIVFMMAECEDASRRPDRDAFVPIDPRNLSATSISFYCSKAPAGDSVALLMGNLDEDPIYVTAEVTSCNEGVWDEKRQYLVGCDLTRRL